MSENQRSDARAGSDGDAVSGADRDAKIEQLLLVGLDHYFSAQHEQAINVWTRALFLDRSHPRARAYIERARSALAERQRESEELEAMAAVGRPGVADSPLTIDVPPPSRRPTRAVRRQTMDSPARSGVGLAAGILAGAAMLAIAGYGASVAGVDWRALTAFSEPPSATAGASVIQDLSIPVPRRGEMALARARALAAGGHLREALSTLDGVRPTDVQRDDADRLRADIQRQLLALTALPPQSPPIAADRQKGDRRVP